MVQAIAWGLVLACVNLFSIGAGFALYVALRPIDQITLQGTVALVFSVGIFLLCGFLARRLWGERMLPQSFGEYSTLYLAALIWAVVMFVPVHYLVRGYLTALSNLTALLAFQLPTNAVVLAVASALFASQRRRAVEPN